MKYLKIAVLFIGTFLLIAACSKEPAPEDVTLKIAVPNEPLFYQAYGLQFEQQYPHIKLDLVDAYEQQTETTESVDIMFYNDYDKFMEQAEKHEFLSLNAYMKRDKFDKNIMPHVLTMLRSEDEQYYGLAPSFESQGLIFNKRLFDQFQVPYPQDEMSWEEIIRLAQQFPLEDSNGNRIYGLMTKYYVYIPAHVLTQVGRSEGLSYIQNDTFKVTINTTAWKEIWKTVLDGFQGGHIYDNKNSDVDDNAQMVGFEEGFTAMTIANKALVQNISNYAKASGKESIDWGVVTIPVDAMKQNIFGEYQIYEIYAISKYSGNKEEAWEFLKFILSEAIANDILSDPLNTSLSSLANGPKLLDGRDISSFYKLDYDKSMINPYTYMPYEILNAINRIVQEEFYDAMSGDQTIEQAMEDAQTRGQQAVDETRIQLGL